VFLRDLYDHVIQVIDAVETFREMLSACWTSTFQRQQTG